MNKFFAKIEKKYGKKFMDYNTSILDGIISYVETCHEEFNIVEKEIDSYDEDDIDYTIEIIQNGLKVTLNFEVFWNVIKNHIPKSITKLKIPFSHFNIQDLSLFPNVKTLVIDDISSFRESDLEYILNNTNIREIILKYPIPYRDFSEYKSYASTFNTTVYKDLIIRSKNSINDEKPGKMLTIYTSELNNESSDILMSNMDTSQTETIRFSIPDKLSISITNNEIEVRVSAFDVDTLFEIYNYYVNKGYKIKSVTLSMYIRDSKFKYTEFDFSQLDKLSKNTNFLISYDNDFNDISSYLEFKGYVEAIKWYKKLINDYDLSPLEKVTFTYDIMKTFNYNKADDFIDSVVPHRIVETGNIICSGYTSMLNEILSDIDENISIDDCSCDCYESDNKTYRGRHSRSIIRIDDEKYNVHGIYILDPTWDSFHSGYRRIYGQNYDALSLYEYFLIPLTAYKDVFTYDSLPYLFGSVLESLNYDMSRNEIEKKIEELKINGLPEEGFDRDMMFRSFLCTVLQKYDSIEEKLRSFDSRRINKSEFSNLISRVRESEGYSGELLEREIENVLKINSRFFKDESETMTK